VIYTVTLNPAVDKTVVIPNFLAGEVNRIQDMRVDAGGKGINVSKCLKSLEMDSTVATFLGGSSGEKIRALLTEQKLTILEISVPGETRTNVKIVDTAQHKNTDINEPGPKVSEEMLLQLRDLLAEHVKPNDVVVLAGSLPKGADTALYGQWVEFFGARGARVVLDADGEAMRKGVGAKPYFVKPNDIELAGLVGKPLATEEQLISAGRQLQNAGIHEVLISRGEKGALYISQEGVYKAEGLRVPVLSTVGAGDSMVAAVAYGFEKGMSLPDRLRLAVAMGTASVMCSGTQAPSGTEVWKLFEQVHIEEV
jgi:1-phosphofructokinase